MRYWDLAGDDRAALSRVIPKQLSRFVRKPALWLSQPHGFAYWRGGTVEERAAADARALQSFHGTQPNWLERIHGALYFCDVWLFGARFWNSYAKRGQWELTKLQAEEDIARGDITKDDMPAEYARADLALSVRPLAAAVCFFEDAADA